MQEGEKVKGRVQTQVTEVTSTTYPARVTVILHMLKQQEPMKQNHDHMIKFNQSEHSHMTRLSQLE